MNEELLIERVAERLRCSRVNVRWALKQSVSEKTGDNLKEASLEDLCRAYARNRDETATIIQRVAELLRSAP